MMFESTVRRCCSRRTLYISITFFLLTLLPCESVPDASSFSQLNGLPRARPHVFYTIATQGDSLEFLCDRNRQTLIWILPNNQVLNLTLETLDLSNETIYFRRSDIIITPVSK